MGREEEKEIREKRSFSFSSMCEELERRVENSHKETTNETSLSLLSIGQSRHSETTESPGSEENRTCVSERARTTAEREARTNASIPTERSLGEGLCPSPPIVRVFRPPLETQKRENPVFCFLRELFENEIQVESRRELIELPFLPSSLQTQQSLLTHSLTSSPLRTLVITMLVLSAVVSFTVPALPLQGKLRSSYASLFRLSLSFPSSLPPAPSIHDSTG